MYELPLLDGFIPAAEGICENNYMMDELGRVTIHIAAVTENIISTFLGAIQFAKLPVGFRPSKLVTVSGFLHQINPRSSSPVAVEVNTGGDIRVHSYNQDMDREGRYAIYGEVSFIAAL